METNTITIHVSAEHLAALKEMARRSSERLGTTIDPDVVAGVLLAQELGKEMALYANRYQETELAGR
jgi:hypothetical protein